MRWILPLFLIGLFVCVGCSTGYRSTPKAKMIAKDGAFDSDKKSEPRGEEIVHLPDDGNQVAAGQIGNPPGQPAKDGKPPEKKEKGDKPRKIRYTAEMRLIVEDLDKATADLDEARKEAKGDYAKVEINTSANAVRSGMWHVRVPVDNLHTFRKAVAKLGEVTNNTLDSEEMTG